MSPRKSMPIRRNLRSLVSQRSALELARSCQFLKRSRALDLSAFLWTLVLGFGAGGPRTYAGLYEIYLGVARRSLAESSFFAWLNKPGFADWAKLLVAQASQKLAEASAPKFAGVMSQFQELFVADASVVQVARRLAGRFPASNNEKAPAAIKVHLVQRVGGGSVQRVEVTEGKRSENRQFRLGDWVRNSLLLMDLGYYSFRRFARIRELGGDFVSRMSPGTNPVIRKVLATHRGRTVNVVGEKLQDVLGKLKRKVIDLEVEVEYQARTYSGRRPRKTMRLRLVGIWHAADRYYRLYFTSLSPEQATAQEVADLYRLRWQVELFIKELKGVYKLGDLPGENAETVMAMAYLSVLSALVTRRIVKQLQARHRLDPNQITDGQAAKVVQRHALELLRLVLLPAAEVASTERTLDRTLVRTLRRRSRSRPSLKTELQALNGNPDLRSSWSEKRAA